MHTGFCWGGELEGKRQFRRTKRRWEDSIKTDLQEMGWAGMNWIDMAQDRNRRRGAANAALNLEFHTTREMSLLPEELFGFSGRTLLHGAGH